MSTRSPRPLVSEPMASDQAAQQDSEPEAPLKAPDEKPEAPLKAPDEKPEAPLKAPDEK